MSTAYSVIAQVLASMTAFTALRMYDVPSLCWYDSGNSDDLTYASAIHMRWPVSGSTTMYGSASTVRNGASDVIRVAIWRLTSARLFAVSELLRKRLNPPKSCSESASLSIGLVIGIPSSLGVGMDLLVAAARRIAELGLRRPGDDVLRGVEPAVDARVGGRGVVERQVRR